MVRLQDERDFLKFISSLFLGSCIYSQIDFNFLEKILIFKLADCICPLISKKHLNAKVEVKVNFFDKAFVARCNGLNCMWTIKGEVPVEFYKSLENLILDVDFDVDIFHRKY